MAKINRKTIKQIQSKQLYFYLWVMSTFRIEFKRDAENFAQFVDTQFNQMIWNI